MALCAAWFTGCAGGGSSHGASVTAGAVSAPGGAGAVSAAQWQVALAALGTPYTPTAPDFDDASLARWSDFIRRGWPAGRASLDPMIRQQVTQALASLTGGIAIVHGVRSLTLDTAAPPAFAPTGLATRLDLQIPAVPGTWGITATLDVSVNVSTSIIGIPISAMLPGDLTVSVQGIEIEAAADFDMSDPRRPRVTGIGAPRVDFQLGLTSTSSLIQQAVGPLTQALRPVVQTALLAVGMIAPSQVSQTLAGLDVPPWGTGGPGAQAVTAPADLRAEAESISDEIQRVHMPFGTVIGVVFDQTGYGNGKPVHYQDYGDSAIWTGSYLAGEAMRWELTQDPRALAGAARALDGLAADLDVAGPQSGMLARATMPVTSPFIGDISGWSDYYTGFHNGVAIGGIGQISRDQYLGALMGLTQTMLRVPPLRAQAAGLLARMVAYFETVNWIVPEHNTGLPSAVMVTSADLMWAFLGAANIADRPTFGALHDANLALPRCEWLSAWVSSRQEWGGYFKFNLGHEVVMTELACDTDPGLYREHLKGLEITRSVVGHHENAWFDAVYAIAAPSAAPGLSAQIETELQRWCLRPRRDFSVNNSSDPTIQKAADPNPDPTAPPLVAAFPVPIEKRPSGDFCWQTSPFDLDGGGNPYLQQPGMDFTLPYWAAKSFGILH